MPIARSIIARNNGASLRSTPITLKQLSPAIAQLYASPGSWSPANVALAGVVAGNLLLTLGGWWDSNHGNGGTQAMPTDSQGVISAGANPILPDGVAPPGWPVQGQIGHQLAALAGTHTVTPQNIGGSGDGYFMLAEFECLAGSAWSLVDSGSGFAGSATKGAVNGFTLTTAGTAAQVGDLVIAVGVTDGDPSAIGIGAPTSGGYAEILATSTTTTNIALGIGWKVATAAGAQSASWAFDDNDCQLGDGVIAVYRRS